MIRLTSMNKKLKNDVLIRFTHHIHQCLVNPLFTHPVIQKLLQASRELVSQMENVVYAGRYQAQGVAVVAVRKQLENTLSLLITQAELLINDADLTDEEREAVAINAGFTLRKHSKRQKQQFGLKHAPGPGEIIVTMAGGKRAYEVQYTEDVVNFTNKEVVVSTASVTRLKGLKSGTRYAVFHRTHNRNENSAMVGPLFIVVH
jgi:tRNA/tmRNA/rRNA uracil-C5-methylase (TrmA/RlmC/RlmD family)